MEFPDHFHRPMTTNIIQKAPQNIPRTSPDLSERSINCLWEVFFSSLYLVWNAPKNNRPKMVLPFFIRGITLQKFWTQREKIHPQCSQSLNNCTVVRYIFRARFGGGDCQHFRLFDRISDLDEKCLYSAKNVYMSKHLKKISPSLKNVYILWKMFTLVNIFLKM